MKRESLTVVVCATLIAMTVAFSWFPVVFLVPTLFAACCFGFRMSFFTSAVFGIVSLLITVIAGAGASPVAYYFFNYPWIPLVPRLFVGVIAHAAYRLGCKVFKQNSKIGKIIPISFAAAIGSLSNTVLVGACILIVNKLDAYSGITLGYLVTAGLIEIGVTMLVLPPLVLTVKRAMPRLFAEINQSGVQRGKESKDFSRVSKDN